jgi:hypothetical protein
MQLAGTPKLCKTRNLNDCFKPRVQLIIFYQTRIHAETNPAHYAFSQQAVSGKTNPYLIQRFRLVSRAKSISSLSSRPPTQPLAAVFYIRTAIFDPVAPLVPRFLSDLGFHASGEPRPSPAFRVVLGDSGRNENARNGERACGVGKRKGSSPPLILFPSKMCRIYPFSLPKSPTVAAPPLLVHHHAAEEDCRRRCAEG